MNVVTVLLQISVVMSVAICSNSLLSNHNQRNGAVAVGEIAPDFTLEDQNGNKVSLSAARSNNAVVLVFYRGYW